MYMMAKHIHLTAVVISVLMFVIRFLWSQFDPTILRKKWVKIVPHVVDTILLASAIWLCFILLQYPFVNSWLTFKVFGVIAYILLGLLALKWARTALMRWVGFVSALIVIALTAEVAITKQPLFF